MKIAGLGGVAFLLAAFMLTSGPAQAADKYQSSIVEADPNATGFSFAKSGSKVSIKPSIKAGEGGIVTHLNVKFIDCPPNNDKGKDGKCGESGLPIEDHVMHLGVSVGGLDIGNAAGITYSIEKGKAFFPQANNKNKINGAALGPLVTLIFDQPLGIGLIKLRTPGSNPASCTTAPAPPTCLDGDVYGLAGIVVGNDPSVQCTANAQCPITAICVANQCEAEPCTIDADCDAGGGVGTGECGSNGECCDPGLDVTCAGQVP